MSSTSSTPLRIAIVGGGPGGLVLARILQKHGIRPTIYEREPSASSREQGGSLDLHSGTGLTAMRAAGLFGEFRKLARYEDDKMRILDKNCVVHYDEEAPTGPPPENAEGLADGRPEIDR